MQNWMLWWDNRHKLGLSLPNQDMSPLPQDKMRVDILVLTRNKMYNANNHRFM